MTDLITHLKSRGMDPYRYSMAIDEVNRVVTFYLHNGTGDLVGYQIYRPDSTDKKNNDPKLGRYYTYLPKQVDGVFGLEQLNDDNGIIYIVEGIFKAAVLHRLGYNAIAVLTSSPKRLKPWFKIMRQKWSLVAIGDPDAAGQRLVNIVGKGFTSPKDLDEMTDDEIRELLRK